MSVRTIVEINHDYGHMIAERPEEFLSALQSQINSADDPATHALLKRFGIRVVASVHHTTGRRVLIDRVVGKEEYKL